MSRSQALRVCVRLLLVPLLLCSLVVVGSSSTASAAWPDGDGSSCSVISDQSLPSTLPIGTLLILECFVNPSSSTYYDTAYTDLDAIADAGTYAETLRFSGCLSPSGGCFGHDNQPVDLSVEHGALDGPNVDYPATGGGLPDDWFRLTIELTTAFTFNAQNFMPNPDGGDVLYELFAVGGLIYHTGFCDTAILGGDYSGQYPDGCVEGANISSFLDYHPPPFDGHPGWVEPFDPCDDLDLAWTIFRANGTVVTPIVDLGNYVLRPGDSLRALVSSTELPYPEASTDTFQLYLRLAPGYAWDDVGSWGIDTFPEFGDYIDVTVPATAADIDASLVGLRCNSTANYPEPVFWDAATGWAGIEELAECPAITMTIEFDPDGVGSDPYQPVSHELFEPGDGMLMRLNLDHADGGLTVNTSIQYSLGGVDGNNGLDLLAVLTGDTVFPGSIEFDPFDHADGPGFVDVGAVDFLCVSGGVESPYDGETGGFGTAAPGDASESCMAQTGMSLTSPASWVRGLGRMAVCLAEYLFVPDSETLSNEWDELTATAETHVPVAWVVNGVLVVEDSVTGLSGEISANSGGSVEWLPAGSWDPPGAGNSLAWDAQVTTPSDWVSGISDWSTLRDVMGELVYWSLAWLMLAAGWRIVGGRTSDDAGGGDAPEWASSPHQWGDDERPFS